MALLALSLLLLLPLLASALDPATIPADVVQLTDATFDDFVLDDAHARTLVLFYQTWCGHCKAAAPEFYAAAKEAAADAPGLTLAVVNCGQEERICSRMRMPGFPMYYLFRNDDAPLVYAGSRRAEALIDFANDPAGAMERQHAEQAAKARPWLGEEGADDVLFLDDSDAQPYIDGTAPSVLLAVVASWCPHCKAIKEPLFEAARRLPPKSIAVLDGDENKDAATQLGLESFPTIYYTPSRPGAQPIKYEGERTADAFVAYVETGGPPFDAFRDGGHVRHATAMTWNEVMDSPEHTLVMFYAPWCGHCKAMKSAYAEAAKISPATYVAVDATIERQLATRFDVKGYPTLLHFRPGSAEPIKYTGERTAAALATFWAHDEL